LKCRALYGRVAWFLAIEAGAMRLLARGRYTGAAAMSIHAAMPAMRKALIANRARTREALLRGGGAGTASRSTNYPRALAPRFSSVDVRCFVGIKRTAGAKQAITEWEPAHAGAVPLAVYEVGLR
jgi:hypothetical protein